MKVYAQEIKDGLQEIIENNNTVAYCAPVISEDTTLNTTIGKHDKDRALAINLLGLEDAQAENKEQMDLYYLSSVLVSTGWNKNDDVFAAQEMWAARSTPEDKQFNYMHDEKDIIGHITANYVVDFEGSNLDGELSWAQAGSPKDFNIITQGVLYKSWSDPELRERMNDIIEEIEEGNRWYVSMECLFPSFDYALKDETGLSKVIRREEASAFLSKHLRAYGGAGKYEGYTVGRLLRNISFSGKGLVSKPANPRSVILNDSKSFSECESELVTVSSIKETIMSDVLQKQLEDVKAELVEARLTNETMKQEMENQRTEATESQLKTFEEAISSKDEAIAIVQTQVEETLARVKELEESLAASETAKEEAISTVAKIEKAAALEKRVAALTEAGLEGEELDEAIAKFEDLDQETFDFVVAQLTRAGKMPPWLDKDKKDDKDKDKDKDKKDEKASKADDEPLEEEVDEAEAEAQTEELEDAVEDEDIAMAAAIDDSESSEDLRSTASQWFGSLLKTTANLK
tara:strand:+ start:5947 stop:7500 length:1554 start_codon:yes stop_codon:yes gene_type:complete